MLTHLSGLALAALAVPAQAGDGRAGGKLLLTDGVTGVEGAAGGGIAAWALIAGSETADGIGGTAAATLVDLPDYRLTAFGGAIGLWNRLELSYARQRFDTRAVGPALGLKRGFTFGQDVFGAKLRVAGDAVWDQDRILPQISVGVQHKIANRGAVIRAIGGRERRGTDFYAAATKLVLSRGVLLNATARYTKANQFGLLGFGGDRGRGRTVQFEGSAAVMLARNFVAGAEVRTKPDRLGFAQEDAAFDLFAAWAVHRNLTLTAAYADLGDIATVKAQRGLFLQARAGF
ncbi:MAG: DUF3034 family protein [Sphingomonas sp.]